MHPALVWNKSYITIKHKLSGVPVSCTLGVWDARERGRNAKINKAAWCLHVSHKNNPAIVYVRTCVIRTVNQNLVSGQLHHQYSVRVIIVVSMLRLFSATICCGVICRFTAYCQMFFRVFLKTIKIGLVRFAPFRLSLQATKVPTSKQLIASSDCQWWFVTVIRYVLLLLSTMLLFVANSIRWKQQ
jgi:hypothetical protein